MTPKSNSGTELLNTKSPLADGDSTYALNPEHLHIITSLTQRMGRFEAVEVIEGARVACLARPLDSPADIDTGSGPTRAELITLLALTAPTGIAEADQAYTRTNRESLPRLIDDSLPLIDKILHEAQAANMAGIDLDKPLDLLAAMMRGAEIWTRKTSYPEMVAETLVQLFGQPKVSAQLTEDLGFDAEMTITVLDTCHALQQHHLNSRMKKMVDSIMGATKPGVSDAASFRSDEIARRRWMSAWEPEADTLAIAPIEITAVCGIGEDTVRAVLSYFSVDVSNQDPLDVVLAFTTGMNPLRTNPVVASSTGRFMLVHDAHILVAVREKFEEHLKKTPVWETYQKHRGDLLESRTQTAFNRVLPAARVWNGFDYYVPANDEETSGPPSGYTKRVEGDHLIVQDDVVIIIEDKAVAISPAARSGATQRLYRDLVGIIKNAAVQASRLQDRIHEDGGIRVHGEGWVDLSCTREIHTIAVSLDDLTFASTATAELVKAGLIDRAHIPWTVSLHDLDLITQLVDRPSEFLLYLRRRRDPEATVYYTAPDEMDLFLYFFQAGLYVEPDPVEMHKTLTFLPPPTPAVLRKHSTQPRTLISSLTEPLDLWYESVLSRNRSSQAKPAAPKPQMVVSPLQALIDTIHARADYGWLSIGATLLSGSAATQETMAQIPAELLDNPTNNGRGRSVAMPIARSAEDGWLLVWITRPTGLDRTKFERNTRDYLRIKMHQLSLPRGVAFAYDEPSRELMGVYFDDHVGELEPRLLKPFSQLRPVGSHDTLASHRANKQAVALARNRASTSKKKKNKKR